MALNENHAEFVDPAENYITSMGTDFVTYAYLLGGSQHIGIHVEWDAEVTGVMYLEYSGDYDVATTSWVTFNAINVDNTMRDLMFLDANLAVARFRIKWQRLTGNANVVAHIIRQKGH